MNPMTWVASGHVGGFSDPLMDCKECKERFRADKVIEDWCHENNFDLGKSVDALSQAEMKQFIDDNGFGNTKSDDALTRFYNQFMAPNKVE